MNTSPPRARRPSAIRRLSILSALLIVSCGYVGLGDDEPGVGFDHVDGPGAGGTHEPQPPIKATGGTGGRDGTGGRAASGGDDASGGFKATGGSRSTGGSPEFGGAPGFGGFGGAFGGANPGRDCPSGATCDWQCRESNCMMSCGENSSCLVEGGEAKRIALSCAEGAHCVAEGSVMSSLTFACEGAGRCDLDCGGANICYAQCTGTGSCDFDCQGAEPCSMQCAGPGACLLRDAPADQLVCNGVRRSCAGGVTTCNRPCPVAP